MESNAYHSYKTSYERGDIWYVESADSTGSEQKAGRPAIIVSNDIGNKAAPVVEVVFLTTQDKNNMPTHVPITSAKLPSTALCEQVTTVSKSRLGTWYSHCTDNEMKAIDKALAVSLCIDCPEPTEVSVLKKELEIYKKVYDDMIECLKR